MSRRMHLEHTLRQFERFLAKNPPSSFGAEHWAPFKVLIAERRAGRANSDAERGETLRARELGYPKAVGGIYLFTDVCSEDDPTGIPADESEQFTVIRYIGSTVNDFDNRFRNWQHGSRQLPRHRWVEIIPLVHEHIFLARALELFLLRYIATTHNSQKNYNYKWYGPRVFREW
jgi:hypothetical protein